MINKYIPTSWPHFWRWYLGKDFYFWQTNLFDNILRFEKNIAFVGRFIE